jgi:outer membrane protein OmpA-like peptidoglycan-associated protein
MIKTILRVGLLVVMVWTTQAQVPSIGIKGGYLYIWNTSTLPVIINGGEECGLFENGTSNGFFGGVTGEYSLFGDVLELSGSVYYAYRPAQLSVRSRDNFEVLDPRTNSYVTLLREHTFVSSLGYVSVDIGLRSRPLPSLPIYIRAAVDAGNPLVDATYTQNEEIVEPDGVLFPDGTKRRETGSGEYPGLGTSYGAYGGIGAVISLGDNVELCPEVGFRLGLNSLTSTANWTQSYAVGGLQLRYRFHPEPEPEPQPVPEPEPIPEPEPEPAPQPLPVMIASVSTVPLEINETIVTQTFPLLPYVFFDEGSANVPTRYQLDSDPARFDEAALEKKTLPIYYHALDIVGKRMTQMKGKLTVTGTTDGVESTSPEERRTLARRRAEEVVSIIRRRWNIDASRFDIRTVEKPVLASNEAYDEGIQENRRVELTSNNAEILGPVVHSRFNEYVPVQPRHDFRIDVLHPEEAAGWSLDVAHDHVKVGERNGASAPPSQVTFLLDQEMTDRLGPVVGSEDTLTAELLITQRQGNAVDASTTFPLRKSISNYEVSRLSLIVFDYDRADISDANRTMMERVIASAVRDGSTATVVGSTDRLGEQAHNQELSTKRARSVDALARAIAPSLKVTEVKGIGASNLPYDNSLPEGRFYCRTVSLTITTPLR